MGYKCKMTYVVIVCVIAILLVSMIVFLLGKKNNQINYSDILVDKLSSQQQVAVKDIFDFDFDRAYVFKDSYISGEGFAKSYNLNISINLVNNTDQEYVGRVVFVDESGDFVFEYQYDKNKLAAIKEGMIIYPNTMIQKSESAIKGVFSFEFISSEYY